MFDIRINEDGRVMLKGRLDASQADKARAVLDTIDKSCVVDFKELTYISSAGLGELLGLQKRLMDAGEGLTLVNFNEHIRDIFRYAGFHTIFEME
ncbi:MAG: STAS domain-containing protein [bacterium]